MIPRLSNYACFNAVSSKHRRGSKTSQPWKPRIKQLQPLLNVLMLVLIPSPEFRPFES